MIHRNNRECEIMNCTQEQTSSRRWWSNSPRGPMVLPSTASEAMAGAFNTWCLKVSEEDFQFTQNPQKFAPTSAECTNNKEIFCTSSKPCNPHQTKSKVRQVGRYHSLILVTPIPAKLYPLLKLGTGRNRFWSIQSKYCVCVTKQS